MLLDEILTQHTIVHYCIVICSLKLNNEPKCLKVYVIRPLRVKTKVWFIAMCITLRSMTGICENARNIAVSAVSWSTCFLSFVHQYRQIYFGWIVLSMANHHVTCYIVNNCLPQLTQPRNPFRISRMLLLFFVQKLGKPTLVDMVIPNLPG